MNRYFSSFIITFIVYSLVFTTFLYSFSQDMQINSQPKQNLNNIKFTVIEKQKPKEKIEKTEPVKDEPKPQEVVKEVKKTEPKKEIVKNIKKPKPIKKEIIKEVVKSKPIKKIEQIKPPQEKIVKQQIKQEKKIVKNIEKSIDEDLIKAKQDSYFKFVKEAISKNKQYPKVAARRGIQGDVKVNFTISKNGELLKYDIVEGHKIFQNSIVEAFSKTFPIKPPEDIFLTNTDLSITIAYRLN